MTDLLDEAINEYSETGDDTRLRQEMLNRGVPKYALDSMMFYANKIIEDTVKDYAQAVIEGRKQGMTDEEALHRHALAASERRFKS